MMKSTKYRLAIIEDKTVILDALVEYFASSPHFCLVLTAQSKEQFFVDWQEHRVDLLLCDSGLPNRETDEVTWYIKRKSSSTQVVVFTVFEDKEAIFAAICAGASDYLMKSTPLPQVEERLLEVLSGSSWMSPQVASLILEYFDNQAAGYSRGVKLEPLTHGEHALVFLLRNGATYRQVAEQLGISVNTLKFHIRNIYGKLQWNSRDALVDKYKRFG